MQCPAVLKSGKNKGQPCRVKACKRHAHDPYFPTLYMPGVSLLENDGILTRADTGESVCIGEDLRDLVAAVVCSDCGHVLLPGQECACGGNFEFEVGIATRVQ